MIDQKNTYLEELVSIIISGEEAEFSGIDLDISLQREVLWHHWAAIWLEIYQALEEGTLRNTRVYLLGLGDHDRLVLQVVEDGDMSHSGILEAALNDVLFEVTVESQDLSIINKLEIRSSAGAVCAQTCIPALVLPISSRSETVPAGSPVAQRPPMNLATVAFRPSV